MHSGGWGIGDRPERQKIDRKRVHRAEDESKIVGKYSKPGNGGRGVRQG